MPKSKSVFLNEIQKQSEWACLIWRGNSFHHVITYLTKQREREKAVSTPKYPDGKKIEFFFLKSGC